MMQLLGFPVVVSAFVPLPGWHDAPAAHGIREDNLRTLVSGGSLLDCEPVPPRTYSTGVLLLDQRQFVMHPVAFREARAMR